MPAFDQQHPEAFTKIQQALEQESAYQPTPLHLGTAMTAPPFAAPRANG